MAKYSRSRDMAAGGLAMPMTLAIVVLMRARGYRWNSSGCSIRYDLIRTHAPCSVRLTEQRGLRRAQVGCGCRRLPW
jgi:hypothetical protein